MELFELKRLHEITWEDIPFIEAFSFAFSHTFSALNYPSGIWMRVINIREFIAAEFGGAYNPIQQYSYAEDRVRWLLETGGYFCIARSGKPFLSAFTWKENSDHPHKGEWIDPRREYYMNTSILPTFARLGHQWHRARTQAYMDELMGSPYAIAREVKTAAEKPLPVVVPAKNNQSNEPKISAPKKPEANTKSISRSGFSNENEYDKIIWQSSQDYGVPPEILKAKIRKESGFNNSAINMNNVDGSTTVGLGQFTELTAINMGLNVDPENGIDERTEPSKTIPAQAKYLREIYDEYRDVAISDADGWRYALAGYNLGPAKVDAQLKVAAPQMENGKIPYNHPSMTFHRGSYTPTIMGTSGDTGGWAAEYSADFDKYRN